MAEYEDAFGGASAGEAVGDDFAALDVEVDVVDGGGGGAGVGVGETARGDPLRTAGRSVLLRAVMARKTSVVLVGSSLNLSWVTEISQVSQLR
ncbi:hypothetical protein [Streptomyces albipurpureus]|uniref:Uncharacterized protein n=1 Tax=Streptomyces albipurpureus TaxID=2897419 RepID=A0ABT0UGX3_9ACTN|nr:hypothetical protein [Streptomyces sp. CWNU-1]MCM2386723.1 hypothetical protein [Streptomyces sp. CWNU-1]